MGTLDKTAMADAFAGKFAGATPQAPGDRPPRGAILDRSLRAIRTHLGMDVAFISEFSQGRRHFRHVDERLPGGPVLVGGSDPLEDSYCQRVVDGRLPEVMPDACANAEALTLAATKALPVGAHLSVPIRLSDGRLYGTLCCFDYAPDETLNARDQGMLRVFADMVADQIEQEHALNERKNSSERRIDRALMNGNLAIVYQPIYNVADHKVVGFESLSRFSPEPVRSPDQWFSEAASIGRGVELESRAIQCALQGLSSLADDVYVSINASPGTIVQGGLPALLDGLPLDRIVLELTEHEVIEQYDELVQAVKPLQERGLRIAIDDAGAGYACFRHVLNLAPHIIKLDVSITRGIDADRSRRALASALCGFAAATDCKIVAEGVETSAELSTLRELGITKAQGFFLGRPMQLQQAMGLAPGGFHA